MPCLKGGDRLKKPGRCNSACTPQEVRRKHVRDQVGLSESSEYGGVAFCVVMDIIKAFNHVML